MENGMICIGDAVQVKRPGGYYVLGIVIDMEYVLSHSGKRYVMFKIEVVDGSCYFYCERDDISPVDSLDRPAVLYPEDLMSM